MTAEINAVEPPCIVKSKTRLSGPRSLSKKSFLPNVPLPKSGVVSAPGMMRISEPASKS